MISSVSLNGIRIFTAVVKQGSYAKAAKVLNLSNSAVSKAISSLEERLGVVLFQRTTRQIKLTEEGRIYFESCEKALTGLMETEEELKLQKQNVGGTVRLSLPVLFGKRWVLPILLDLSESYPHINFDVSFTNEAVDLIDNEIDLTIRIGHLPDSTHLMAKLITYQGITTCASPLYFRKHGTPETIDSLREHQCIVAKSSKGPSAWFFSQPNGKTSTYLPKAQLHLEGSDSCMLAALSGRGIAQTPTWLAEEHLKSKKLISILEDKKLSLPIHVVWTKKSISKKIRVVIDELVKRLATQTY